MGLLEYINAMDRDRKESRIQTMTDRGLAIRKPDYSYAVAELLGKGGLGKDGHSNDVGKLPNHPTFSNQSAFSSPGTEGGVWGNVNGVTAFEPSVSQVLGRGEMSVKGLANYMKRREPGVLLKVPAPVSPEYFDKVAK